MKLFTAVETINMHNLSLSVHVYSSWVKMYVALVAPPTSYCTRKPFSSHRIIGTFISYNLRSAVFSHKCLVASPAH